MSNESTSVDVNDFRRACGLWGTGVSIVTTCDAEGRPFGLTMNAVSSLSLAPPMLLVCVDRGSDTLAPMTQSRVFCVNVLAREQEALSNRFAKKGQDKFSDVAFTPGSTGAPVLAGTLVSFECAVQLAGWTTPALLRRQVRCRRAARLALKTSAANNRPCKTGTCCGAKPLLVMYRPEK
jgi:flavin reductase (DIM6/NTAB) family NADH-FMN oxidoreductase RutF